jgi:hypothetical protein
MDGPDLVGAVFPFDVSLISPPGIVFMRRSACRCAMAGQA